MEMKLSSYVCICFYDDHQQKYINLGSAPLGRVIVICYCCVNSLVEGVFLHALHLTFLLTNNILLVNVQMTMYTFYVSVAD